MSIGEVVFIPNEYAVKGVVIGHPETVAAVEAEVSRLTTLTASTAEKLAAAEREVEMMREDVGQLKQGMWRAKDAEIARWKDAYENMRGFAKESGLDITCYGAVGAVRGFVCKMPDHVG